MPDHYQMIGRVGEGGPPTACVNTFMLSCDDLLGLDSLWQAVKLDI